jgi:DNA-binding MarR family transcriptional regulator
MTAGAKESAGAHARKGSKRGLDESAVELATLLTGVFHAAKKRGPSAPQLAEAAERENLGPRHAPVLFAVALDEGQSVSEIAERVGLSVATTSLMVGELSRAGIVARAEDERDRRRTIVTIPDPLKEQIDSWKREVLEPMRRTLERLPADDREAFMRGIRLLAEETGPADPGC